MVEDRGLKTRCPVQAPSTFSVLQSRFFSPHPADDETIDLAGFSNRESHARSSRNPCTLPAPSRYIKSKRKLNSNFELCFLKKANLILADLIPIPQLTQRKHMSPQSHSIEQWWGDEEKQSRDGWKHYTGMENGRVEMALTLQVRHLSTSVPC